MEHLEKSIKSLFFETATKEIATELNNNKEAHSYITSCGGLLLDNNEEIQVQIVVTRKKENFIGAFDIIEYKTF